MPPLFSNYFKIALRKIKRQKIYKESFLIIILAFILAFGLISLLLFPFNQIAGTELSLAGLKQPVVLLSLLGLLLFISIESGCYPALILTAVNPVSILQGKLAPTSRGAMVQKFLVVGQFAISIFLVICTLTVFKQLDFMKGRALDENFEREYCYEEGMRRLLGIITTLRFIIACSSCAAGTSYQF